MFEIYYSNSLDILAEKLTSVLQDNPLPPLENEAFIIQSEGMAYWLRLKLASTLGCASGFNMLFPGNFCRNLCDPGQYNDNITWEIFAILADSNFILSHPALDNYLRGRDERKLLQLARRMDQLFSEYLIYRHDMLLEWENGKEGESEQEAWQAELWRRLAGLTRRAAEFQSLLDDPAQAKLPARISVFGVSTLPPLFLRFLHRISSRCEVNLYLPCATEHFWADIRSEKELLRLDESESYESGHPLLSSLAKQGREFFSELMQLDESGQYLTALDFHQPPRNSALEIIQSDILNMRPPQKSYEWVDSDRSIDIHNCHSPLREVEVLHDQILALLDENPHLQPSDILVTMSDVESYAPWVRAVFGSCPVLKKHFRISDRTQNFSDPKAQAFIDLLAFMQGRQEAPQLLALLDYDIIREQAGLEEDELPALRELVTELNIRWGISAKERSQRHHIDIGGQNSWKAGIDRLMLGYATGEVDEIIGDILPYRPGIDYELVGRFVFWLERVFDWCAVLNSRSRGVSEWKNILNHLGREILGISGSDEDKQSWLTMQTGIADPQVSLKAIAEYVTHELSSEGGRGAFLGGGISFCALRPMRAVPFKVVVMMGMDYNRFPRRNSREGYNLMQQHTQNCDRNPRNDDRQLFLETVLSAGSKLIITYSGYSQKDLSVCPPSVCVSELTDTLERTFRHERDIFDCVCTNHPLQPFSRRYFDGSDSRLFSYNQNSTAQSQKPQQSFINSKIKNENAPQQISLEQLIRFWLNPAEYFAKNTLQVFFPRQANEISTEETIETDALTKYKINNTLLDYAINSSIEHGEQVLCAKGELPPLELGKALGCSVSSEVKSFSEKIGKPHFLPTRSVTVELEGITITANLNSLIDEGVLQYRMGKIKGKDLIRFWLTHLIACCDNEYTISRIIGTDSTVKLAPAANPQQHLQALCNYYMNGLERPLPFAPQTSYSFVSQQIKLEQSKSARKPAIECALESWVGNDYITGDADNEYLKLCFGAEGIIEMEQFTMLARDFWLPYFSNGEEER